MNKKPNIILIIVDQMRADALGSDGNRCIQTPNLDYLASLGTRFSHAYSAVPSCLPARAALWSGQDQWHTGVLGMGLGQPMIPNNFPHTLPGELTAAGYRTHLVGKGHFHPQRSSMGFQSMELDESGRMPDSDHRLWFKNQAPDCVTPDDHGVDWNSWHARPWHTEERLHPTYWTMTRALHFLETHDAAQPFFLNISFARPHSPYVPPAHYFNLYEQAELPAPHVGEWAAVHDDPKTALNPNAWRGRMTPAQIRRARAGYYGEISFIDSQIGRLLGKRLNRNAALLDDTWIFFTSDHGDMQGDHNLWRKTYAYEGSARIPFIIVPPRSLREGIRRCAEEVVELRDIMPTALEAAGLPIPRTVIGRSLGSLLKTPAREWREYIHGEHCACYSHEQEMQYVTNGRRKFIWLPRIDCEQFFDLEQDPGECLNLIADPVRAREIELWRGFLTRELEARNIGWTKNGRPFRPNNEPLVSPYRDVRLQGADA